MFQQSGTKGQELLLGIGLIVIQTFQAPSIINILQQLAAREAIKTLL